MSMYGDAEHRIAGGGDGGAKQSMKDECDVNLIMATYTETGFLAHVAQGAPSFADVSELTDYRSALEHVRSVEAYFAGFPAEVRARFANDHVAFMEYLESGASEEDLKALGLEVLPDRRGRAPNGREGDVEPVMEPPPAAPEPPPAA